MRSSTVVIVMVLALVAVSACAPGQAAPAEVPLGDLLAAPDRYNGRMVTTEGFAFHGWEVIVLAERLEVSGLAPGHLVPRGKMVWLEGGIPRPAWDQMYMQQSMGPQERFAKMRIKGRFDYGGKYGHVGGYEYQIEVKDAELLPWSPPKM